MIENFVKKTVYVIPFKLWDAVLKHLEENRSTTLPEDNTEGIYSRNATNDAKKRREKIRKQIESAGQFFEPCIRCWEDTDGRLIISDFNTRYEVLKAMYKDPNRIFNEEWFDNVTMGAVIVNNEVNPKTGRNWTYEEFVEETHYLNQNPGTTWSGTVTLDVLARGLMSGAQKNSIESAKKAISLHGIYSNIPENVVASVVFDEQGLYKKGELSKKAKEGVNAWPDSEKYLDWVDRVSYKMENNELNKTLVDTKHGVLSIMQIYKMLKLCGDEKLLLDFMEIILPEEKEQLPEKPVDWQKLVYRCVNTTRSKKNEEKLRTSLFNSLTNVGFINEFKSACVDASCNNKKQKPVLYVTIEKYYKENYQNKKAC